MKKVLLALLVLVICLAADMPPMLPAGFWGYTSAAGTVSIWVGNQQVASTSTMIYQGQPVYSVLVLVDKIPAGTVAQFRLNGYPVTTAKLYTGTNTHLDLYLRWWISGIGLHSLVKK